jgi:hypothetical protein
VNEQSPSITGVVVVVAVATTVAVVIVAIVVASRSCDVIVVVVAQVYRSIVTVQDHVTVQGTGNRESCNLRFSHKLRAERNTCLNWTCTPLSVHHTSYDVTKTKKCLFLVFGLVGKLLLLRNSLELPALFGYTTCRRRRRQSCRQS